MIDLNLYQYAASLGYKLPSYKVEKIVRFNAVDKPNSNKACWLKVFGDGGAVFGNWQTGEQYHYNQRGERLPKNEWIKLQKQREKERALFEKEQLKQQLAKAKEAKTIIVNAKFASSSHPYLVKKGILSHGILFGDVNSYKKVLIIPVIGSEQPFIKQVQSLQFIKPNGSKRFLSGAKLKGGYYVVKQVYDAPIVICEGFSTGCTLAEHYAPYSTVVCAFNANNLVNVAQYFRFLYPKLKITIAGDNDHTNVMNIGQIKATKAAQTINAMVSIPEFTKGEKGSDWNDRYILDNANEVSQ